MFCGSSWTHRISRRFGYPSSTSFTLSSGNGYRSSILAMAVSTASSRYSLPASSVKILPEHKIRRSTDSALWRAPSSSSTAWKAPSERSSSLEGGHRVPEETLRRHDDEGTLDVLECGLGAKKVEVLGRRGEVGYAHVLVGR